MTSVRRRVDEVARAPGTAGRTSGTTVTTAVSPLPVEGDRAGRRRRPRWCAGRRPAGSTASRSSAPSRRATTVSGPLTPGPKPSREQVVGLPGGGRGRVVALVGGAEVQGERGQRERPAMTDGGDGAEQLGVAFHEGGPAGGEAGRQLGPRARRAASLRRSRRLRARVPMKESRAGSRVTEAATVRTTVREAAIATPLRKLSRRHQHAEQRDADGGAREDDGAPGGGDGVRRPPRRRAARVAGPCGAG